MNALVALLDESHVHHASITEWFATSGLQWALCPFTEAGVLRFLTRPKTGGLSMEEASLMLAQLKKHSGYCYQPVFDDWHALTAPFSRRLHGYRQITDGFLLGLAISEGLTLVTFDRALLHLAGEHSAQIHLLGM